MFVRFSAKFEHLESEINIEIDWSQSITSLFTIYVKASSKVFATIFLTHYFDKFSISCHNHYSDDNSFTK